MRGALCNIITRAGTWLASRLNARTQLTLVHLLCGAAKERCANGNHQTAKSKQYPVAAAAVAGHNRLATGHMRTHVKWEIWEQPASMWALYCLYSCHNSKADCWCNVCLHSRSMIAALVCCNQRTAGRLQARSKTLHKQLVLE